MSRFSPHLRIPQFVAVLAVAALALSLCAPAEARGVKRRPRKPAVTLAPPAASHPAPASAGAVIAVDPETGKLGMPSAAQMLELTAADPNQPLPAATASTQVRLANGAWTVFPARPILVNSVVRLERLRRPLPELFVDGPTFWMRPATPAPVPAPEER